MTKGFNAYFKQEFKETMVQAVKLYMSPFLIGRKCAPRPLKVCAL